MQNYYLPLHVCCKITLAEEAIERSDPAAAPITALECARDIMRSEVAEGRLCLSCHIEIQDDAGIVLMVVPFKEAVAVTGFFPN